MKRSKASLANKITTAFFVAMILSVVVFSHVLFKFGMQAHERGSEIQIWKAALIACLPVCMAIIYSMWIVAAHSPEITNLISSWLRDGWPSRLDRNGRLPITFDRLASWMVERQSKIDAIKAMIVQHDVWRWGLKPIGLGLCAAIAVAPLLFVAPLVGTGYGMRFTFAGARTAALVVWAVATLTYLAARWFGVLDGNDRTRAMRSGSGAKARRVSDLFQDGVVPVARKTETQASSKQAVHSNSDHTEMKETLIDAEYSMRDFAHPQLAPPPDGFEWKFFRNAVFIQPKSWHVIVQEMPPMADGIGMDVYATSLNPFSSSSPFETGFTVQVMSGMKSGRWQSAKHAYAAYITPFMDQISNDDILLLNEKDHEHAKQVVLRYRDVAHDLPPVIVHKFFIVNDALEHVHVFTFESPEVSWQEQWRRYGEMIMRNVGVVQPPEL